MIENAAVFVNGRRQFKNVNIDVNDDGTIVVRSRVTGVGVPPAATYSVVEVAKAGMAWDIDVDGERQRLVIQQGCGCSGMKPYKNDPEYTGPFPGKN